MMTNMTQVLSSMENSVRLRSRAAAERRAARAEQEKKEFLEKLMRTASSDMEIDGMAAKVKGSDDAVQRDQLMEFLMAGF